MQTHSATLLTIPGFAELTPIEAAALLQGAREMRVPAGKQIMGKGEPASTMVVLLAGRLRVSVASLLGRELTFRLVEPVDVVGEIAMLDGNARTADVATAAASRLLVIRRDACLTAIRDHPAVALAMLRLLCARLRETSAAFERLVMQRLSARMAHLLLRLAAEYGQPGPERGVVLPMRMSQSEIGSLVAATREAVNKQLRLWRDEEVLDLSADRIVLYRPEALTAQLE
jgi:CRP/FNR family cyclic AMP-dependent transcriptional regulator